MNIVNKDSKNTFTRMCIGEAIIKLLKNTDFDKIRITSVAKCAGVSRITFYKYYESIHDALCDYLNIIIIEYLEECANNPENGSFLDYSHILLHLNSLTGIRIIFLLFQDVDFILFLLTVLIILCLNILRILRITLSTDYTVTLADCLIHF